MAKAQTSRQPLRQRTVRDDPQAWASAILGFGSLAWRLISAWANFDFLLSMREEKVAMAFDFFANKGWLILLIVAIIWAAVRYFRLRDPNIRMRDPIPDWTMVICSVTMAFLFGVLFAIKSSQGFPTIINRMSFFSTHCNATIPHQEFSSLQTIINSRLFVEWLTTQ